MALNTQDRKHSLIKTPSKSEIRVDLRALLDEFETDLFDLKVRYEQYFTGVVSLPPDDYHKKLKAKLRKIRKAPFKSSALIFRLKALEHRYMTFHTYWHRVLREKEEGTYARDIFKADLRQKMAEDERHSKTAKGASEKHMESLFNSYKSALEKETGRSHNIDYKAFQKSLLSRVKELKQTHGAKKFSFKVMVQNGKVTLKAVAKD